MNKNMNTILLIMVSIIALIAILGSISYLTKDSISPVTGKAVYTEAESVKAESVKIGYKGHLLYLPAYVAEAKGYYQEEGLQAELIKFDSTNQLVEAVLAGKIDAGVGGVNALVPLIIEGKAPGSLKIFNLGYLTDDFDALLVSKDSDIQSVQDLKGKTISSLPGTAAKIWMELMLEQEDLEGEVTIIQTAPSQQLNALGSGSVDAIFVLEPLATIGESKGISRTLVQSPISTYYQDDLIFETSVFSTKFYNSKPATAKKIIRAVDKAIVHINENPKAVKEYYSEFTPVDDSLEQILPVGKYYPSYAMDADAFQEDADIFLRTGLIEERIDVATVLIG